jgi:hypothetical protein
MKNILIALLTLIVIDFACISNTKDANKGNTITLEIDPVFAGMVGYGYVFNCKVKNVIYGDFNDSVISMTLMGEDMKDLNLSFYEDFTGIKVIEFELDSTNVESKRLPISGFVDMNHTSWEIKRILDK